MAWSIERVLARHVRLLHRAHALCNGRAATIRRLLAEIERVDTGWTRECDESDELRERFEALWSENAELQRNVAKLTEDNGRLKAALSASVGTNAKDKERIKQLEAAQ